MRAMQITQLTGPESALALADIPEPAPDHPMTPGSGVLVDVKAAGVSFPELLQTRGEYQLKPQLPFVPGSEVGGIVRAVRGEARSGPGTGWPRSAGWPPGRRPRWRRATSASRSPTTGTTPRAPRWCSTTTPPTSR